MLLLAAWSTNGWLPSGHAMRMALDLGLHRALEKLADSNNAKRRSDEEERDLGTCVHIVDTSPRQSIAIDLKTELTRDLSPSSSGLHSCLRTDLAVSVLVRSPVRMVSVSPPFLSVPPLSPFKHLDTFPSHTTLNSLQFFLDLMTSTPYYTSILIPPFTRPTCTH